MVWIKICGITNTQDALDVVQAGANALGFVFASSPRQVTRQTVHRIVRELPEYIEKVGVFVNEDLARVADIAQGCGLTGIQLHGFEPAEYCQALSREFKVIKAFSLAEQAKSTLEEVGLTREEESVLRPYLKKGLPIRILLDTYSQKQAGGTGKTFAWERVSSWKAPGWPVIMAGGLNPANIGEAIRVATPYGVDVSSGVEAYVGKKDRQKIIALMAAIKEEQG